MAKRLPRDDAKANARLAGVLRRILAAAAVPETSGALAGEILRFTAARLVVLVQTDADAPTPAVAPDNRRILLDHPVMAALLREAGAIETSRFYASETAIPGLAAIQSEEGRTNCLAVPLNSGELRVGILLIFGLTEGEALDTVTGNAEMLAPVLATVLHNAMLRRQDYRTHLENLVDERTREVRIRQERLVVALESTNTGLWEWNPITRAIYFSPTYFTMLGWAPDEFPADQETWTSMVHPDDLPTTYAFFHGIANSPDDIAFSHEYRLRSKPGAWRWFMVRGKIVGRNEQGLVNRVVGVYIDITERKSEDKRLRMAMQALDTTRECVYWIDQDGRMLYVNPATEQELGYSSAELLQMTIPDIDPSTPPEMWGPEGELTRRLNDEGLRKFVTQHRHRDGHLIPVEVDSDAFYYGGQTYFIAIARDISRRLEAEEALRKSEAKFALLFNLTPEPMALTRLRDGVVLEVSRSYAGFFGYLPEEIIGRSTLPGDLGIWVDAEQRRQWKERIERDGEVLSFETPVRRKDGSIGVVLLSGKALEIGGEQCVILDFHDITKQKQQAEYLEQIAHHDPLTGLPNRLLLGDRLSQAIARNQRSDTLIAVCYLDLDGFKEINDRFGHQAGDELLVEVANRLIACVRGGDTVVRLGGDEFVVLLSGLSSEEECRVALDRLLQTVAAPYAIGNTSHSGVSASIGVTLFPNDQVDPDTLVRHADHAMYVAKQAGKNRYQMFDTRLEQRIEARLATLGLLAEAQRSGQFRLYYQPKVDCRQGRVVGVEALIRWQHPTLGLLSPAEFLPLIEDTDLAPSIGDWVIKEAMNRMAQWRREGIDLCISVNAFVRHLLHPGFVNTLVAILSQYPQVKPGSLVIEIVETAALKELDAIRQVIEECRSLGVTFSLDDFGTGYSTLAHLRHLPATEIKIDHSFVRHMLERTEDFAIVEAVIGMARAFGRSIVAEGAETPAHIIRLLDMGCDVMQGYALARPMAAADITSWVRKFRPDPFWYRPVGGNGKA
ncbi:MAG: EAL domain-containing protein [Nitrosomonadales bacterium]|nr:EAL domain-containing protein [Nitrosomonadales bacterium]